MPCSCVLKLLKFAMHFLANYFRKSYNMSYELQQTTKTCKSTFRTSLVGVVCSFEMFWFYHDSKMHKICSVNVAIHRVLYNSKQLHWQIKKTTDFVLFCHNKMLMFRVHFLPSKFLKNYANFPFPCEKSHCCAGFQIFLHEPKYTFFNSLDSFGFDHEIPPLYFHFVENSD